LARGRLAALIAIGLALVTPTASLAKEKGVALSPIEQLGKAVFFDKISDHYCPAN
jgi:hypothetical protein